MKTQLTVWNNGDSSIATVPVTVDMAVLQVTFVLTWWWLSLLSLLSLLLLLLLLSLLSLSSLVDTALCLPLHQ